MRALISTLHKEVEISISIREQHFFPLGAYSQILFSIRCHIWNKWQNFSLSPSLPSFLLLLLPPSFLSFISFFHLSFICLYKFFFSEVRKIQSIRELPSKIKVFTKKKHRCKKQNTKQNKVLQFLDMKLTLEEDISQA